MAVVFKLPDLGENIESAQVVSIAAAVGDYIEAEQTLIEVETDKAVDRCSGADRRPVDRNRRLRGGQAVGRRRHCQDR